jgi:hypothetical protein
VLGLGKLAHLRVLLLDGNRSLDVQGVVDAMCCKAPLFGVPLLMGWDSLRPLSALEQVSLDIKGAEARVRLQSTECRQPTSCLPLAVELQPCCVYVCVCVCARALLSMCASVTSRLHM